MARRRKNSGAELALGLTMAPFAIAGALIKDAERNARIAEREARRNAKIAERQAKLRQKQRLLEAKLKAMDSIFDNIDINTMYSRIKYSFESLKKSHNIKLIKVKDLIHSIDELDLTKSIKYISYGQRVEAIKHLIENTDYNYNEIIKIILSIEYHLSDLLEYDENARDEKSLGQYEFEPFENLLDITKETDNYTAHTDIMIECSPINYKEYISGKSTDVVINRVIKALDRIYKKWNKAFCKYHLSRENNIVTNIKEEFNNILNYSIENPIIPYDFNDEIDTTVFSSTLPVVDKPILKLNDINSYEKIYRRLENNPPKREDIPINSFDRFILKTFFKFIVNKWLDEELGKREKQWHIDCEKAQQDIETKKQENIIIQDEYNKKCQLYQNYLQQVENEKAEFLKEQKEYNKTIKEKIDNFKNRQNNEIVEFFKNSLDLSVYPILKHKNIDISYNSLNKIIIIDYEVPNIDDIYSIEKVTYKSTQKEFEAVDYKPKELSTFYNNTIYQICIRTIKEIFDIDNEYNFVDSVVFNGMVVCNNKATGKQQAVCICSLQANKQEFKDIDLSNIVPKYCFKLLKGVGAAELNSITPIAPIRVIDKNDKRFIDAYEVLSTIDTGTNLAAMYWKDFENLIREVFEKEFSRFGGDVKITQSSRDGGVDAVAFDPDPIRGGKIIIQAKRYTNVVGVSAVRDLYGTLMNEGANSGILVTTSDYGSDAYEFAKGKPINLLNGAQLLGLMKKHGYDCYINLQEAKKTLQDEQ